MEVAKLVLEFVRALVWPALALAAVVEFRRPLHAILERVRGATLPGGVTLDFDRVVKDAGELSKQVRSQPQPEKARGVATIPLTEANARMISIGLQPTPSGLDFGYYRDLAEKDPNLALAGLRMEVEILARNLAEGFNVETRKRESAGTLLTKLWQQGALTREQFELARKVVELCNAAVHGRRTTTDEADEVLAAADVLAEQYLAWLSWGFPDGWKPK